MGVIPNMSGHAEPREWMFVFAEMFCCSVINFLYATCIKITSKVYVKSQRGNNSVLPLLYYVVLKKTTFKCQHSGIRLKVFLIYILSAVKHIKKAHKDNEITHIYCKLV